MGTLLNHPESKIMNEQMRILFYGHVQGVGFRFSVKNLAAHFDVTGYVRNLSDGSVELVCEGERKELRAFLNGIKTSHLLDHIHETKELWDKAEGRFGSFVIAV